MRDKKNPTVASAPAVTGSVCMQKSRLLQCDSCVLIQALQTWEAALSLSCFYHINSIVYNSCAIKNTKSPQLLCTLNDSCTVATTSSDIFRSSFLLTSILYYRTYTHSYTYSIDSFAVAYISSATCCAVFGCSFYINSCSAVVHVTDDSCAAVVHLTDDSCAAVVHVKDDTCSAVVHVTDDSCSTVV